jgi:hypothetical protein
MTDNANPPPKRATTNCDTDPLDQWDAFLADLLRRLRAREAYVKAQKERAAIARSDQDRMRFAYFLEEPSRQEPEYDRGRERRRGYGDE